jgi:hypothetical protein
VANSGVTNRTREGKLRLRGAVGVAYDVDVEPYVDDLVTLGTPHQGTYAAYWALLTRVAGTCSRAVRSSRP